jgi:hypothetical protein
MAINPELITTIRVDQLPDETLSLTNLFPHTVGTDLKSATIQELVDLVATAIGVSGGVGYIAISVTDGQQLPDVPELPSFFLCGAGTFLNVNGYPNIICTENLNAIMSLTDHWELAVEIPINPLSGTVESVTGSAVDNTDPLNPVINITGGAQTFAEVLLEGNKTDGTDISISDGDKIVLDNGANLKKGTTDAGLGGTKGIALRCAVHYELKWEAGRLYVMGGDGFTIREVSHNFTTTPTVNDDDTKGFVVDSRWILDNGDVYVCTDDTTGAAVWELVNTGTTPTLQQVLNEGNTATTNNLQIIVGPVDDLSSIVSMTPSTLITAVDDAANNKYVSDTKDITNGYELSVYDDTLSLNSANKIVVPFKTSGSGITNFKVQNNLPAGDYELATLDDIPTGGEIPHATAAGTDTYTATVTGVAAYNDADAYLIRFTNGNTTGATLNINALGAKTLYRNNDGALIGGDIINGGEMLCIYNSSLNGFQLIGTAPNSLFAYVTNADSVTITKGMPVYAFGGTGDRMTVKRANNTSDASSAQTVGLVLSTSIAAGQKGLIMMQGLLDGLSILPTATFADGDPVYLGATAGTITNVKPYAPNHLVYLGVVTTASNGSAGRMYVRVQNGYELSEIHDVDLISNAPTNNQALTYETSTDLWKNKTIIEDNITNGVTTIAPSQNAVFDALALKQDIVSGVSNTEIGYLDGVTSAIQTQLDGKQAKFYTYKNPVLSTGVTGTLSETEVLKVTIPANTFSANDFLKFQATISKIGILGACTFRIKLTSSSTMPSGTTNTIATFSLGTTNLLLNFSRTSHRIRSGNIFGYLFTNNNNAHDFIASGSAQSSQAFDVTIENYLYVSLINGSIADTTYLEGITITNQ